jgi:hypothetical protein
MSNGGAASKADHLQTILGSNLDYSHPDRSFSPFYSDLGLGFDDSAGIAHLYLHYNRRTTAMGAPLLPLPGAPQRREQTALYVRQDLPHGTARFAFCARNTWLMEARGLGTLGFGLGDDLDVSMYHAKAGPTPEFVPGHGLQELRREITAAGYVVYDAYLPNRDKRDPDERFPFVLGVRVIRGSCRSGKESGAPLVLTPNDSGELLVAFSANELDVEHERLERLLAEVPDSLDGAIERSRQWLTTALGNIHFESDSPKEAAVLAKAAFTLVFNACEAPGMLAGRVSAFPSRGTYPVHYLWDSCFQNLALEQMDPRLAPDSLLLLTENLRHDGKMYHFMTATWPRPQGSQPPLVGWAGLRLVKQRNDLDMARRLLPALMKNNRWWLTQRMTRYGIITCPEPLETGWDDTPRLDHGAILALDMNSHLLLQMRACVELARMLHDGTAEAAAQSMADRHATRMVELLYDETDNLFKDVLVADGQRLSIKTPACFLPLLAGVPIDDAKARRMIEDYLLNPKYFFGRVPFPCVAYDEPTYKAEKWWRGPTWMPVAYLMLEVLRAYGYADQAREATRRLHNTILADGNLRELFNSASGEGLGAHQQGWTAAICLRLRMELDETR